MNTVSVWYVCLVGDQLIWEMNPDMDNLGLSTYMNSPGKGGVMVHIIPWLSGYLVNNSHLVMVLFIHPS